MGGKSICGILYVQWPFLLTSGSVNDIRIFHHTPMSRWQASTYLNMSFSEGKSPGFVVHHISLPPFKMIVNDRPGSEREAFTCVAACVVLDSCHCLHIVGRVWSLYWHLSYDGVLCEA